MPKRKRYSALTEEERKKLEEEIKLEMAKKKAEKEQMIKNILEKQFYPSLRALEKEQKTELKRSEELEVMDKLRDYLERNSYYVVKTVYSDWDEKRLRNETIMDLIYEWYFEEMEDEDEDEDYE